ncbi:MAG: RluA family pseudouridine synthase [Armatimonadota bacterium]|jgi:23S rRNA pseudouridine1911/1915/1917 synthase
MSASSEPDEPRRYQVTEADTGARLDVFVATRAQDISRAAAQRLIRDENVLLNGKRAKPSTSVAAGDTVQVTVPSPEPATVRPQPIPLSVAYEDDDLIVIDKPSGMVVHPAPGNWDRTLVNALLHHCTGLARGGGPTRRGVVHRLDKDTSGLLVVAKTDLAHRGLTAQIQERTAERVYWAIVWGSDLPDGGRIDAAIGRHPVHRKKMAVLSGTGRRAATRYRTLERFGRTRMSLVEVRLLTGRTHQIRVHFAHIGHPVVGDPTYGRQRRLRRSAPQAVVEALSALDGQALHARALAFDHPGTGERLRLTADPPDDFAALLAALREHGMPRQSEPE